MPARPYKVVLSEEERNELETLIRIGKIEARKMKRAQILLKAAEGWTDVQIDMALDVRDCTIARIRRQFVEGGLEQALNDAPRPDKRKLVGPVEAQLIALARSPRPDGRGKWSLRLLAEKLVELGVVESISHETVRKTLKKIT